MNDDIQVGLLVFPELTQLDLTGPLQVFSSVPGVRVHLVGRSLDPVPTDTVLTITPTVAFADCPQLDVICVPGGHGIDLILEDAEYLHFLRAQAAGARYVTSVCTGALLLGAAGLLAGYRATTHWSAIGFLEQFGAEPVRTRVCVDRDRVTGGGITAGIDFALRLVAELVGQSTAEGVQLRLEYDPHPPFEAGSPDTAPPDVLAEFLASSARTQARRTTSVAHAADALRS
jgi:cyclohexyl-isocyanide hydratase